MSEGLPDGEFRQKAVIVGSSMYYLSQPVPSVLQEESSDACVYTRESVCREAASFKRASRRSEPDDVTTDNNTESGTEKTGRALFPSR